MKYEVRFFENDEEVGLDHLPDEYINGIVEICISELRERKIMNRFCNQMFENISNN